MAMQFLNRLRTKLRSMFFCYRYLPFSVAKHLPIIIGSPIDADIKGEIKLDFDYVKETVLLFGGGSYGLQSFKGGLYISEGGVLLFTKELL